MKKGLSEQMTHERVGRTGCGKLNRLLVKAFFFIRISLKEFVHLGFGVLRINNVIYYLTSRLTLTQLERVF